MAKKKIVSKVKTYPEKLLLVSKHGINIYPLPEAEIFERQGKSVYSANSKNWYIEVNNNGKIKTFQKAIIASDIQDAIWKTIVHYHELLTDKK